MTILLTKLNSFLLMAKLSNYLIKLLSSDATGLGRTRQKPDLDYFLQTETRTRIFNINPNQTRLLIFDKSKYKNPTKNPNPAEPEAKVQTDPKPEPDWLNPSRSRTRLFETRCVSFFGVPTIFYASCVNNQSYLLLFYGKS